MSLTKVINTGIKNAEITGSKINTSSSFSFDVLQANTLTVANDLKSNTINLIFNAANSSGVYANAAFSFANTISGGAAIDNVARTSANSASSYANSGFGVANTANALAQSAFDAANNAVDSYVRDAANSASSYANSAFLQANTPSQVANAAFTAANVADQRAVTSGVYANAAYTEANLKFNSSGGLISGDVTISGNIIPTTDVTYNIGNSSNRIHTIFVGPGSIDIDGIILSNNNGQLTVSGALDFLVQGFPTTLNISDKINLVFDKANSAHLQANTPSQTSNSASSYANAAFTSSNVADQKAVSSGVYANSAYLQANTPSQVANSASSYANSAYTEANTRATISYVDNAVANLINSAPATLDTLNELATALNNDPNFATTVATNIGIIGVYANAAYLQANTPSHVANAASSYANGSFTAANVADQRAVTSGVYANSAYLQANTPSHVANSASSYANGSFTAANVADQRAVTSGVYANSAYLQANTPSHVANSASVYANAAFNFANTIFGSAAIDNVARTSANSASSYANGSFTTANVADQKAVTSGNYANSAYLQANTPSQVANAAFTAANVADQKSVTSGVYANAAYLQANTSYLPSVTRLNVSNSESSAYLLDQYSGNNPTIYVTAGETISFNLNVSGHPFVIRTSSGGSNYDNGLTHVSTTGTVLTGSAAQGQVTGILYWKVPFEIVGSTYVYQCTIHGGMVGSIRIGEPSALITTQTVAAFNQANTANILAQSAFNVANNAVDNVARTSANSASSYANSGFGVANTANALAQSAFDAANNAVDSYVRDAANSASSYANSGFGVANTANTLAQSAFNAANNASAGTDDYARNTANSASLYANAAYDFANTISGGSAIDNVARTSANSASSYANSAFLQANTPSQVANAASSYANGAFVAANTADQRAVTSGVYANSAFLQANTPSQVANAASSYANGAFAGANTANTLAQAAYDQANTGGGGGGSGLFNPLINIATGYGVTSSLANAVVFSANAIVHSIYLTNISNVSTSNIQVTGDFTPSGSSNVSIFHKIPLPFRSSVEMLKKPQIVKTNDILKLQSFNNDVGVSANAYAIIVYETTTETSYERVGKLVTDTYSNMYTSTSNPSVVESIKLVNRDSTYGNHAITIVWTNSANTLQGYLTKELILPANSTIELCETPKYMNAGDKFDAWATTTNVISIFVSAKKII